MKCLRLTWFTPRRCASRKVELYAEFAPELLLKFLRASPYYPLEEALVVCQRQQLHAEAVYVLGRMGSAKQALQLVLGELREAVLVGAWAFLASFPCPFHYHIPSPSAPFVIHRPLARHGPFHDARLRSWDGRTNVTSVHTV